MWFCTTREGVKEYEDRSNNIGLEQLNHKLYVYIHDNNHNNIFKNNHKSVLSKFLIGSLISPHLNLGQASSGSTEQK